MDFFAYFATVFFSLFIVVDVFANLPIFIALTEGYPERERRAVAKVALAIALFTLLVLTVCGRTIFRYLHIEMYSFQVAGGILLMIVAVEMLFGRKTRTEYGETEAERRETKENITVVPLAIPLHTGPAAIMTSMVLYNQAEGMLMRFAFLAACVVVYVASLFVLIWSDPILKILRPVGAKVITRIMGLLLSAIAVQFVANGIVTWVNTALRRP